MRQRIDAPKLLKEMKLAGSVLVALLLSSTSVLASGGGTGLGAVELHGFGSFGMQKSSVSQTLESYKTSGSSWDFAQLSHFGINLHSTLTDQWSVSAQLLAKKTGTHFPVDVDWGFLAWTPSQEFSVRAGRLVAPIWFFSQELNVGFNYPWITPPTDFYTLNPIHSINGFSLLGRLPAGPGVLQMELVGGDGFETQSSVVGSTAADYESKIKNALVFDLSYNMDDRIVVRAGVARAAADLTVHTTFPLPAGTLSALQPKANIPYDLALDIHDATLYSLGLKANYRNFILLSELGRRLITGTAYSRASGAYGTLGYQWGRWLPNLTYSWSWDMVGSYLLHPDYPTTTVLQKNASSWTVGLAYQASDEVRIKPEWTHNHMGFVGDKNDFDFNVFKLSADFIF